MRNTKLTKLCNRKNRSRERFHRLYGAGGGVQSNSGPSTEVRLANKLGNNDLAKIEGVSVLRLKDNRGVNIITQKTGQSAPSTALSEAWTHGGCFVWVLQSDAKWMLHSLRLGNTIPNTSIVEPVDAQKEGSLDINATKSRSEQYSYSVTNGTALPWDNGIQVDTYKLLPNSMLLIVPPKYDEKTPIIDVLTDGYTGGITFVWPADMQEKVFNFREQFKKPGLGAVAPITYSSKDKYTYR